jgi:hypothetical protein
MEIIEVKSKFKSTVSVVVSEQEDIRAFMWGMS